jgi:ATP phosphoribosyltransferase
MIKVALPAGDLRSPVAEALSSVGISVEGYGEGSRAYRLPVSRREDISTRVFRERDIPIQVALGNYDLGICGLAWVEEMGIRFPEQPVVPLCDLGIRSTTLFAAAAAGRFRDLEDLAALPVVRIASEYPNLAEAFALSARLRMYRVQAVWGSAEAYPPEDADLVLVAAASAEDLAAQGLTPLHNVLQGSAWVIANQKSVRGLEMRSLLSALLSHGRPTNARLLDLPHGVPVAERKENHQGRTNALRLAVPDGHQQRHVVGALRDAGLVFRGYDESTCLRRPETDVAGLEAKVVRPHDMPQLVALGQFDLAVTGRDCLMEHLHRFPSSPAIELVDLKRGQYNLSAVVSEDLAADTINEAIQIWREAGRPYIRVASEFAGTADFYARSRHLWRYQVIPIAGASEGFVPEDAELLIEGTETGKTLRENRLKPIDLLYRSTTCVIGREDSDLNGSAQKLRIELLAAFHAAARAA